MPVSRTAAMGKRLSRKLQYLKRRTHFITDLKQFHQSRLIRIDRLPSINGRTLDLYKLYLLVTEFGGWQKVSNKDLWGEILRKFRIPQYNCVNSIQALKLIYISYLGLYEKVHLLGEDISDEIEDEYDRTGRADKNIIHLLSFLTQHRHSNLPVTSYQRKSFGLTLDVIGRDTKFYDHLIFSLLSALPNEVDFALNACILLSTETKQVLHLEKEPVLLDVILAQAGIFTPPPCSRHLRPIYEDAWKILGKNFCKFWRDAVLSQADADSSEMAQGILSHLEMADKELMTPDLGSVAGDRTLGMRDVEGTRVTQVLSIIRNLSFEDFNAKALAAHETTIWFLLLCINCRWTCLQQMALDTLSNLATQLKIRPFRQQITRFLFSTITRTVQSEDRHTAVRGAETLAHLAQLECNELLLCDHIDETVYISLISILTLMDVQLVCGSLEALYQLSELGEMSCQLISTAVPGSLDTLVSLLTIEAQAYGPALAGLRVMERFDIPNPPPQTTEQPQPAVTSQPPPQPFHAPTPPQPSLFTPIQPSTTLVQTPLPPASSSQQTISSSYNFNLPASTLSLPSVLPSLTSDSTASDIGGSPKKKKKKKKKKGDNEPPTVPLSIVTSSSDINNTSNVIMDTTTVSKPNHLDQHNPGHGVNGHAFALQWLQSTYEPYSDGSICMSQVYADYVTAAKRMDDVTILSAALFSDVLKGEFPCASIQHRHGKMSYCGLRVRAHQLPLPCYLQQQDSQPSSNSSRPVFVDVNSKHRSESSSSSSASSPSLALSAQQKYPSLHQMLMGGDGSKSGGVGTCTGSQSPPTINTGAFHSIPPLYSPHTTPHQVTTTTILSNGKGPAPNLTNSVTTHTTSTSLSISTTTPASPMVTANGSIINGNLSPSLSLSDMLADAKSSPTSLKNHKSDIKASLLLNGLICKQQLTASGLKKLTNGPSTISTTVENGCPDGLASSPPPVTTTTMMVTTTVMTVTTTTTTSNRHSKRSSEEAQLSPSSATTKDNNNLTMGKQLHVESINKQIICQHQQPSPSLSSSSSSQPPPPPHPALPPSLLSHQTPPPTSSPAAVPVPSLKLYCEWKGCYFTAYKPGGIYTHVVRKHITSIDTQICLWYNCDQMPRQRLSLYSHIQDVHCSDYSLLTSAKRKWQIQKYGKSNIPEPQPPPPHPGFATNAAFIAIRRYAGLPDIHHFTDTKEGPVTKSLRITSALILRNICRYSHIGRRLLRKHEIHLVNIASSSVDCSGVVAQCLGELKDTHSIL